MSEPPTILCFGEILWDLLPEGPQLGGAPLNVAYRLRQLGNQAYPVSSLGTDELGNRATQRLQALGLPLDYVQFSNERPTGTVPVKLGAYGQPSYVITPNVAYDAIHLTDTLIEAAAHADCLYFGTLAQRGEESHRTLHHLLDAAPTETLRACDLNLRPECYTRLTVLDSLDLAHIVKLSQEEIAPIAEIAGIDAGLPLEQFARKLLEVFTLQACVVTRGDKGVFATDEGGASVDLCGIPMKAIVDTVGAGDAFYAGFIDAILRGADLAEACRRGNVLGALATQKRGGTAEMTRHEIDDCAQLLT